jgi:hypothetical protein
MLAENNIRVEFWNRENIAYSFMAEAKRLWEIDRSRGDLVTLQAALIMSQRHMRDGNDKLGLAYMLQSVAMAENLEIFITPAKTDTKMGIARAVTAWGLWNWQMSGGPSLTPKEFY